MPGHDHHLQFTYQQGDLNSYAAILNWGCPVDAHDGEDITVIFKRYFNFCFLLLFSVCFQKYFRLFLKTHILFLRLFRDLSQKITVLEARKGFLEGSVASELFAPENCDWLGLLRFERKNHL